MDLSRPVRSSRSRIEANRPVKIVLQVMGVLAVTMVLSDGVLTPAQSVLGAVQGLEVITPNITKGVIVGVTDAILVFLFMLQPLGVNRIFIGFSPIIIIWLGLIAAYGIYNCVTQDAGVWAAWNPFYAFDFLIRNKEAGWRQLGGVLLCFTGVEALFADLGAFSKNAIRISWLGYTFPCLVLTYIGQAAYIARHPEAYSNPVYNTVPGGKGVLIFTLVMAVLAAIVASQAIITATFQVSRTMPERRSQPLTAFVAAGPSHEVVILPTDEGSAHIKGLPWPTLHSCCKLASDDRHHLDRFRLQQHHLLGKCIRGLCHVCHILRHLHGILGWSVCLQEADRACAAILACHRVS